MEQLLSDRANKPDVVYFSNDDMAVGGVFHCMAAGISLPDQIAIAGFNGLDIGQALPIPLTTIGSHRVLIGQEAAAAIFNRLKRQNDADLYASPQRIDVGFTLIEGGTA